MSRRLWTRREEIEQILLTRVSAISGPKEELRPKYRAGMRVAVTAAVEYGLAAVERGEEHAPHIPGALMDQARLAARNGVSLDTVMRRYFAGHSLFDSFLVEEIERDDAQERVPLKLLLGSQATLLDRLLERITEEYQHEANRRLGTSVERRNERVERLLDGELIDTSGLAYDFDAIHVAVVVTGSGAASAIRKLASSLGYRLLLNPRSTECVWGWFGSRRAARFVELPHHLSAWPANLSTAMGEPAKGLHGWRRTHMQAKAALPIAQHRAENHVRYADVPILASVLHDDLLVASIHDLYLSPLYREPDGGQAALETLRAYVAAERKVSSAAAALGLNRRSVAYRLRAIESRLGHPLNSVMAEIEVALQLQDLNAISSFPTKSH